MAACSSSSPLDLQRSATGASDWSFEEDEIEASDEEEDLAFREETGGPARRPESSSSRAARVFESVAQLRAEQARLVEEAADCTGISSDEVSLMLRQYGWDVATFNETFFDNPEAVRRRAGLFASDDADILGLGAKADRRVCGICFADQGVDVMPCEKGVMPKSKERHPAYCRDCWREYIRHAVADGKGCLDIRCPAPGCSEAVRPSQVQALLGRGSTLDRYSRFMAESLVDDSKGRRRWCPASGCGRAAEEPLVGQKEVKCPCGLVWCFGCGTDAHLPVSCETVRKWQEKNRDESGDATWIKVNTKLCPKCQNPIEKNGGCMHMTCRKPGGCGHEFCWICMQPWANHKACNATPEDEAKEDSRSKAKHALLRYAHFYERYMAHHKAQVFATGEQMERMETLASVVCTELQTKVSDGAFLTNAVREIAASRRFLKWTYAFAYFAHYTGDKRQLFEFHQAQLEGTLERLSDVMENTQWDAYIGSDIQSLRPFYDLRTQIMSLTDVVHKFFSALSEAMQQGTLFTGAKRS